MTNKPKGGAPKGSQNALKYGGEGAIRRISHGEPLIGLAAEEEQAVTAELAEQGAPVIIRRDAIRLQSALNLYWNAVQKAVQDADLEALDRYIARFGWLAGVVLRAWAQVQADDRAAAKGGVGVIDILNAIQKEKDNESEG